MIMGLPAAGGLSTFLWLREPSSQGPAALLAPAAAAALLAPTAAEWHSPSPSNGYGSEGCKPAAWQQHAISQALVGSFEAKHSFLRALTGLRHEETSVCILTTAADLTAS